MIFMFQLRLCIVLLLTMAFMTEKSAAQYSSNDSGQYVILSAQYGTARRHVDVTNRLKELARQDRAFRMGNSSFGTDPDPGYEKTLRIYARGPNGQQRMFEYREGSTVDGSQFSSWNSGNWGDGGWNGGWEGGDNDGDSGQYVIANAQYGTARHHVDVTRRLRELARQDSVVRMGNSTFGVDPDPGQVKMLRIYARGPNGEDRLFEFREGSVVNGNMFRGWGRGDWGEGNWNGEWEGGGQYRPAGYEDQPEMRAALQHLREAQRNLNDASHDKGGHRLRALDLVNQAISEVEKGMEYDNRH
jgi:hypothetical protein